jgi:hypothetical protein
MKSLLVGILAFILIANYSSVASDSPPPFKIYKMRTGEGLVSIVVPPTTSDKQLVILLGFIRLRVQEGKFTQIGILHPTDKRFGKLGYGAGIISIFLGSKCANEDFIDQLGPCGYGEHDAASYQWGINGDSHSDEGLIRQKDGSLLKVF